MPTPYSVLLSVDISRRVNTEPQLHGSLAAKKILEHKPSCLGSLSFQQ